jgi:hypothetical protein
MTGKEKAQKLLSAIKSYVHRTITPVVEKLEASLSGFEARFADLDEKIAAVTTQKGDKGDKGDSVSLDEVTPIILSEIEKHVSKIEKPKDGKDADPEFIRGEIVKAVGEIPIPKDGEPGKDADPEFIKSEIQKALEALPKPKDGKDGDSVHPDTVARMIREEVAKALAEMPKPEDGEDGLDALEIDFIPEIDQERKYPKGSYACHKGGVWRAYKSTEGMDGWECIWLGVAEQGIEQVDDRTWKVYSVKSNDERIEQLIKFPVVLDRGVWKPETKYEQGDGATYAGSYWIAQKDNVDSKPDSGNGDWRLAVKRGQNGRDGDVPPKSQGPVRLR